MTQSEQINELAAALAKAQADMGGAKKDADNPFFKSRYADLASVREACMGAMNKQGLSVSQWPRLISAGEHEWCVEVETVLAHSSGQWMRDTLAVIVTKADAQGIGSAITYARRYALGAVAGVAPEDDDGEAAVGRPDQSKQPAAAGAMTTVTVRVKSILKNQSSGWMTINSDDGKNYRTKSEPFALIAKDAQEAGLPVVVTFKLNQFGGRDVVALEESSKVPEPVA